VVPSVRVLTVDDHPAFRDAARALIDATPGFEVAGDVNSGEDAVGAVMRLRPDLVLMDVGLSGIDGYEATRRLRYVRPATVIVLVSASDEALEGETAVTCGAVAWIRKQDLRPSLLQELWQIHGTPRG
jgi:two-component system, NarL family, invasion response regulator UvrY